MELITLFQMMVMGHLVGDFVAQPKWMAQKKADKGLDGALVCTLHVAIYIGCMALFTGIFDPQILLAIAVPHWMVDRFSLAKWHLKTIGGRTEANIVPSDPYDAAFTAIMYTVVDMTIHLMFLWGVLKLL